MSEATVWIKANQANNPISKGRKAAKKDPRASIEELKQQQFYVSSFMIQKIFDELKNQSSLMESKLQA